MNDKKIGGVHLIKAVILFAVTEVIVAFVFAAGMYFLEGGFEYAPLLATVCLAAGAFAAAWYLGAAIGEKGIIIGALVGGTVFIITALITLLVNSGAVTLHLLLRFIIILLSSMIGAIIGVNKKANQKFV